MAETERTPGLQRILVPAGRVPEHEIFGSGLNIKITFVRDADPQNRATLNGNLVASWNEGEKPMFVYPEGFGPADQPSLDEAFVNLTEGFIHYWPGAFDLVRRRPSKGYRRHVRRMKAGRAAP